MFTNNQNYLYKICNLIKEKYIKYNSTFGIDLYNSVEKVTENFETNLSFFDIQNKINECYLDYILQEYCINNKNVFLLIVWPVTYNHENIFYDIYSKYGKILFKKEIILEGNGFKNILHFISDKKKHPWGDKLWFAEPHKYINPLTIYVFEADNINNIDDDNKRNYLVKIFNNNKKHIENIEKRGGLNNLYVTTKAKLECREELAKNDCVREVKGLNNRNYSHHVNDEHYETIELSRIFFNKNSIFAINNCDINYKCNSFNDKYKKYINFINNNKWGNIEDFCLNNSSIISQFGLRQSRDIDYLHNTNFNIEKQIPEAEISSHNYIVKSVNSNININELVYNPNNYFWYKNIKFCTLQKLLEFKKQQKTKKAKNDVKLCESLLLKKKNYISINCEDRDYLKNKYFNNIKGEMLFVGVADYTVSYYTVNTNLNFTTVEFVKERDIYESKYKHISGDFLKIEESKKYDYINLFGVLGHRAKKGRVAKYNMFTLDNVLTKAVKLLNYNGHIMIGPTYRHEKEFDIKYWESEFDLLKEKFIIISKIKGKSNLMLILKPKIYLL